MADAKFKKGGRCSYHGMQVIIMEVNYNPHMATYRYSVEILGGYATLYLNEEDLEPDTQFSLFEYNNCDCGAKNIYGFENCHSFWCSAYKKGGGENL
jgi:hypothetical protein